MSDLTTSSPSATAADWAFEQLFRGILDGEISASARLTEAALSEKIGVSRTPLRDALQRLELAGIVSRQRNRTIKINPPSLEEMERLSMLREVLEGLLVRRVAIRLARGEIAIGHLEEIVEQMAAVARSRNITLQLRLGREFHNEMARLSRDPMATRMLEQVMLSFERYRHLVDNLERRASEIADEHETIVNAIRNAKPEEAEALMRQHLTNARAIYAERLSGKDLLTSTPQQTKD